jgi:hypothetical protein
MNGLIAQQQEQPQFGGIFLMLSVGTWFGGWESLGLVLNNKKNQIEMGSDLIFGDWFRI